MDLKDRQHLEISKLIEQAREIGRTPIAEEYRIKNGRSYERVFGNFPVFLAAAGLEPTIERPRKIDNSIFEVSIEKHLENYQPRPYQPHAPYPTAAVISDIHWPFSCKRVIEAFYNAVANEKPKWVILNGDAWDMYSHSKYPRSHNVFTPREERDICLKENREFWRQIKKIHPAASCVQMMGNHDLRPLKRILEVYPAAEDWIEQAIKSDFSFDGVETKFDSREEVYLCDDVVVFHGYRSKLGDHRDYTNLNCINGHTHTGGTVFRQIRNQVLWEANSGVAGDPEAKGLTYTPQKITHWTPGFLLLRETGPQFISA